MFKKLLFSALIGTINTISGNIHFFTFSPIDLNRAGVSMRYSDGSGYDLSCNKDDIVIIKDHSNKIWTFDIETLHGETVHDAVLTECPGFLVVEYGATLKNYDLCRNKAIRAAYEQFKKKQK